MSVSLNAVLTAAKNAFHSQKRHALPTHAMMLPEHERRKGEELRQQIAQAACFAGPTRMCR